MQAWPDRASRRSVDSGSAQLVSSIKQHAKLNDYDKVVNPVNLLVWCCLAECIVGVADIAVR